MPRPSSLIAANLLVCEKVLEEKDNVPSLIRVSDGFMIPKGNELAALEFNVFANFSFEPSDQGPHRIRFGLLKPDGSSDLIGPETPTPDESHRDAAIVNGPRAFSTFIRLSLLANLEGVYWVTLVIDGEEATRIHFVCSKAQ